MFGKSFDEKVQAAVTEMGSLRIKGLNAKVEGKIVTLTGEAPDMAAKTKAMQIFNAMVETENTVNMIRVAQAAAPPAPPPPAATMGPPTAPVTPTAVSAEAATGSTMRVHEVVKGETLSAIAKQYYGKSSKYQQIFDANKDLLKDPDHIYPGQKLRIP